MKRTLLKAFLLLSALGLFVQLNAQTGNVLDVNINNEDLEVEVASMKTWSRNSFTHYGVAAIKTYDDFDKEMIMYSVTMTQIGYTDLKGVAFGVGLKGVHSNFDLSGSTQSVSALGVRMKVLYTFPLKIKTIIAGTYNYAPKSLSFSKDLERYTEYRLTLNAEPIDGAWVYAGIRGIEFQFENIDETYTFNKTAFAGIEIYF